MHATCCFNDWLQMEAVHERNRRSSGLDLLLGTALAAMHRPAAVLLPLYAAFYSLLVASGAVVARVWWPQVRSLLAAGSLRCGVGGGDGGER